MKLHISIRQLGKKRNALTSVPCELPEAPASLRILISSLARSGAAEYNRRLREGEGIIRPMTAEQLHAAEAVGKLAFGIVYGEKPADPVKAVKDAVLAYEDGLFRVFLNQEELTSLDAPLDMQDGDELTLIRLVMLTGSIW